MILVTGCSGFVGSWVVKLLLEEKFQVRGSVRNLNMRNKYEFLKEFEVPNSRLEFFELDLLSPPERWDEAVKDCVAVIHCACSTDYFTKNPEKDIYEPAIKGTMNLLEASKRSRSVKRIVQTSSLVALSHDFKNWKNHAYNDSDWNTKSTLTNQPYSFTKVQTEKLVLSFCEKEGLSLAIILPGAIYGPPLNGIPNQLIKDAFIEPLNGRIPTELNFSIFVCDVRDVALLHVLAVKNDAVQGRFLCCSQTVPHPEFYQAMREAAPEYASRLPLRGTHIAPKWAILPFVKLMKSKPVVDMVSSYYGKHPKFDCEKTRLGFNFEFRDAEETIKETTRFLIEHDLVNPKRKGFLSQRNLTKI